VAAAVEGAFFKVLFGGAPPAHGDFAVLVVSEPAAVSAAAFLSAAS
jgi:hypothetical protein